ncbi:hypothetical protein ABER23_27485 [Paenibacillus lautus]|uniref:hypothetical protein n=1 Tax=Paenibacillus lautus TaxID=1401 RepID=UPI003D2E6E51
MPLDRLSIPSSEMWWSNRYGLQLGVASSAIFIASAAAGLYGLQKRKLEIRD